MYDRWGGNLREWKYGDTCNCDTDRETDKWTDEIRETYMSKVIHATFFN